MKTIIFTRTAYHHTSLINRLQKKFEIACVVIESYPEKPSILSTAGKVFTRDTSKSFAEKRFLKKFSGNYSAGFRYHPGLRKYLGSRSDEVERKPGTKYLTVKCGGINSPKLRDYLEFFKPEIVAVLGSSVLKQEMISLPSVAMINIHSGLSPYYRGTWSYGWPIVNREPEYIGVTVHHVNAGIDTGDIIFQTKPLLEKTDDLNAIFLKVIAEGIELMVKAIGEISSSGTILSHKQPRSAGRLYQAKDFNAETARTCLQHLEKGVIGEYLSNREERDSGVKLFGYTPPQIYR